MFVRLQGGLGNQMFQAAFGWSTSKKYGQPVYFVPHALGAGCHRAYGLDVFQGDIQFRNLPQHYFTVGEGTFGFDEKLYQHVSNQTLFTGNFQTEKYFDEQTVRENLQPVQPLSAASQPWANQIGRGVSCSIHVRRTDYTISSTARYHGLLGMDYYRAAIAYIKARTDRVRFFVFSDDQKWCRENFVGPDEFEFVDANGFGSGDEGPQTEHEDLSLMALCTHAIIPNSSFGWWGAWLNLDKQRMVVAPKDWFNPTGPAKHFDTSDIIPERWTRL